MVARVNPRYVLLKTTDPASARRWLCEELFFTPQNNGDLTNGDCTLRLAYGQGITAQQAPSHAYYTGLAHISLAAADIDEALDYCKKRGMNLQTDQGGSFFSPKVFEQGERYFNILAPFGVIVEVAQRIAWPCAKGPTPIAGLDHLGVPCQDIDAEMDVLQRYGFVPLFAPLEITSAVDGRIRCCMLSDGYVTLEVYQFLDLTPLPMPEKAALAGVGEYRQRSVAGNLRLLTGEGL